VLVIIGLYFLSTSYTDSFRWYQSVSNPDLFSFFYLVAWRLRWDWIRRMLLRQLSTYAANIRSARFSSFVSGTVPCSSSLCPLYLVKPPLFFLCTVYMVGIVCIFIFFNVTPHLNVRVHNRKKFLLASMKALENSENPSSNPLREACFGVQKAAFSSKSSSESRQWSWKLFRKLVMTCSSSGENQPATEKESRNINSYVASEQSLTFVSLSIKEADTLYLFFPLTRQPSNVKTICPCRESADII
jgi:hypothetical protein